MIVVFAILMLFWIIGAGIGVVVGVIAVQAAASDIQIILAALCFNFAGICGLGCSLTMVLVALNSIASKTIPAPKVSVTSQVDETSHDWLKRIAAELEWQRKQKEKEIHREKAAAANRPKSDGSPPPAFKV